MTTVDRPTLEAWYREAIKDRIRELEALRDGLSQGRKSARAEARQVGHALLGSGGSFGFPEVSEAGRLVEMAPATDMARRVEGLLGVLSAVANPDAPEFQSRLSWLSSLVDVDPDALSSATDAASAWALVATRASLDDEALAEAVARRFDLERADLARVDKAALRLVPSAVLQLGPVLPLSEDGRRLFVATGDPTDLRLEARLEDIAGRDVVFRVAPPARIAAVLDRLGLTDRAAGPGHREPRATPAVHTVLVVDDSRSSRHLARTVLERAGYLVIEAEDGRAALGALDAEPRVDLVVVDLEMPRMDGRTFLRQVRSRAVEHESPIIVLTSSQEPDLEAALIEDGADDYLRKPLDPRLFIARVKATLRRGAA